MNVAARSLPEWLDHAGRVHRVGIDLGLERVGRAAARLGFAAPQHRPAPRSVIVAGTNGKGSTCMALEALLRAAGLRVGTTLSPHLHRFNERVRLDGEPAADATLCAAFEAVEHARGDVPLTYFEFAALVALHSFREAAVDVAILEVGLGGRLDAFNLVHADVAVITSIALDHQDYLGDDLEGIGREKAGVMRPRQRVLLGRDVTASVVQRARDLDCDVARLGVEFDAQPHASGWDWHGSVRSLHGLPLRGLAPDNCALALEAAVRLDALPLDVSAALAEVDLPGRMERWRVDGRALLLDVAHNPAGARFLAAQLALRHPGRRYVAVLGMLVDKDVAGAVDALGATVRRWVCVSTRGARGLSATDLGRRVGTSSPVECACDAAQALQRALSACDPGDGILAFGSFDLVEQMRNVLLTGHGGATPEAARPHRGSDR